MYNTLNKRSIRESYADIVFKTGLPMSSQYRHEDIWLLIVKLGSLRRLLLMLIQWSGLRKPDPAPKYLIRLS